MIFDGVLQHAESVTDVVHRGMYLMQLVLHRGHVFHVFEDRFELASKDFAKRFLPFIIIE